MKSMLELLRFFFFLDEKETNPDARSARSGRAERKTVNPFRMLLSFDLRSAAKPFALSLYRFTGSLSLYVHPPSYSPAHSVAAFCKTLPGNQSKKHSPKCL